MRRLLLLPIRFYQYAISPMMVSRCRYQPSCSQYAIEAITRHGGFKGVFLSLKRLLRCHPWSQSGYDPVPGTEVRSTITDDGCEPAGQTHSPNQTKR